MLCMDEEVLLSIDLSLSGLRNYDSGLQQLSLSSRTPEKIC